MRKVITKILMYFLWTVLILFFLHVSIFLLWMYEIEDGPFYNPYNETPKNIRYLSEEMNKFAEVNGRIPESISQISDIWDIRHDGWGNEFQYVVDKENHTLTITSYGKDDVIGGIGEDADISVSYYYQKPDWTFWAASENWLQEAEVPKK